MKNSLWKTRRLSFWNGPCLGDILVSPPRKQEANEELIARSEDSWNCLLCSLAKLYSSTKPQLHQSCGLQKVAFYWFKSWSKKQVNSSNCVDPFSIQQPPKKHNNCVDDWCVAFCRFFPFFFLFLIFFAMEDASFILTVLAIYLGSVSIFTGSPNLKAALQSRWPLFCVGVWRTGAMMTPGFCFFF